MEDWGFSKKWREKKLYKVFFLLTYRKEHFKSFVFVCVIKSLKTKFIWILDTHYIFVPSNKEYIKSEQTAVCTSIEFNFIINLAVWWEMRLLAR